MYGSIYHSGRLRFHGYFWTVLRKLVSNNAYMYRCHICMHLYIYTTYLLSSLSIFVYFHPAVLVSKNRLSIIVVIFKNNSMLFMAQIETVICNP